MNNLLTDIEGSAKLSQRDSLKYWFCCCILDLIHFQLGDATFENAYNTGYSMTEEQATALAIES
jgi:hypothetical protein